MTKRDYLRRIHIVGSITAFALITLFLTSSMWIEIFGHFHEIASTKRRIALGLLVLIPAIAITGITGFLMAGKNPVGLAATKALRMKIIAANGLLFLAPAALFLACRSVRFTFDDVFWLVQSIEYLAGTTNLVLITLNFRDGLKMSRRIQAQTGR